jgi:hypothetical protein
VTAVTGGAVTGGAETAFAELEEAIDWLERFPDWLGRTLDEVTAQVNTLVDAVPGLRRVVAEDAVQLAGDLLRRIGDLGRRLLDWIDAYLAPVIRGPMTLYRAGDVWTTDVFSRVTEVSGQIDLSRTALEDYWAGPAATAYAQAVGRQKAAADQLAEAVSATREALQGLARTLVALYVALVAGLVLAAVQIAGGAAAVATFLGIPPGLMAIVTGLLTAIVTLTGGYAVGKELLSGASEQFAKLLELRNDKRAFDGGQWPAAAAELGDASMTDGDRSDWSYRR